MRQRVWVVVLPLALVLTGCATETTPVAQPALANPTLVAAACANPVVSQVKLAGAVLTTRKCAA